MLKPFILVLKLVPLAIVGGVGYYGYMSFFGPASDSERNAYLSSPTAGASTGGAAPSSRAGMLIAQVKDVVATHDAGVHAANALAGADGSEQSLSIETGASGPTQAPAPNPYSAPISSTPRSAPSKPGALSGLLDKAKKSVSNATDSVTAAVGSAMASKEDTSSEVTLDFADEPETQIVESRAAPIIVVRQAENTSKMVGLRGRVAPSDSLEPVVARPASASAPDFPGWVSVIEIGEVQDEGHVFVTIDGRQVRPGQIADERLGIRLDRVESTHRVLVFEDALGQTIGKRY
ncbi:hypothetical protein [Synoicihabitans lomoniglobus]|uniref:Uncharacterized protein n=1 Tax=Synoicihabitans lomoniglobus TaxID=2909285 RepID=A0AAE9ZR76_9BACT|nr:hypothetical protein [Opitutaceae bacterium LMO-M01]WED63735.1 hypothetical protein PXH66_15470 [Opitutaceae bacterium LMO-M01]